MLRMEQGTTEGIDTSTSRNAQIVEQIESEANLESRHKIG